MTFQEIILELENKEIEQEILLEFLKETSNLLEEIKLKDMDLYNRYMTNFKRLLYANHFDEETALYAVSKMENVNGTKGEHWTLAQTKAVSAQYGINTSTSSFNDYDFYYLMNMYHSDYANIFNENIDTYVKMIVAKITDPDNPKANEFAYSYYKMVKGEN